MPSRSFPTLKAFYYLDHFYEMVGFLERECDYALGRAERHFLKDFQSLERHSQALFVRIANRKGIHLKTAALAYDEIEDSERCLRELRSRGFVEDPAEGDVQSLLAALTKVELLEILENRDACEKGLKGKPKSRVLEVARGICALRDLRSHDFIVQQRTDELEFLQYLYFGRRNDGLQAFALRDLGIVKTRKQSGAFESRFRNAADARESFFYAQLSQRMASVSLDGVANWPRECDIGRFDSAVARLGQRLEREGEAAGALEVYAHSEAHPARERRCRLLYGAGEKQVAEALLSEMLESPASDEELLFAADFQSRKFGNERVGLLTRLLREAPVILVDEALRDSAEEAAARHYRSEGWRVYRTENTLWNTLFGILFWEELHSSGALVSHNEFDWRPVQLLDGTFASRHAVELAAKIALLEQGDAGDLVRSVYDTASREINALFRWRKRDCEMLVDFLANAPAGAVAGMVTHVLEDFASSRSGYPDLLLVRDGEVSFIEVKGEGDQIRRHQLVQIKKLEAVGFDVGFLRVNWCVDALQEYVVVDIETTGGRAEQHRVTEIGAVKVRAGDVVDRFQTLINPERPIPRMITGLTGITNEMVVDAPVFASVADGFREFVGEAVFVAHSAPFDYGFLRAEFARLGQEFRRPTLCTVVAMRRFYPGLASYKLSKLCEEFGIPLTQHHRALCDAEATVGLLKLINAKRLQ